MADAVDDGEALFWDLAEELYGDPAVTRGTMMGHPCLRVDGAFFATLRRETGDLVVKLPRDRVAAMVEEGSGAPFAPNGRVFREWVSVTTVDEDRWRELLADAKAFVNA
ncbi:MAG TPA: MmcQ/YjbR family DNA-binding protein [Euzebyales bacterium]